MGRGWLIGLGVFVAACTPAPSPIANTPQAPSTPATASATAEPTPLPTPTRPPAPRYPGAVGTAGCRSALLQSGDTTIELTVAGQARTALLHVPERIAQRTPLPLVLLFHGTLMDGPQMAAVSAFSARGDDGGFLVAYPNALGDWQAWNPAEKPDQADDVAFERALVTEIEASHCVDEHRVYAAGFSIGGSMAQLAACRDERIVAIALVAAVHGDSGTNCLPDRPVPALTIHGLLDPLVPWRGGLNPLPEFAAEPPYRDVIEWASEWAVQNGCEAEPRQLDMVGDWVAPFEWQGCRAPVLAYRVGNGGHTWPGGTGQTVFGAINEDIDASELSMTFFLDNALPPAASVYENRALGYRVQIPAGWPQPWLGRYGYHQEVGGSVTFPVGKPLTLDVWATQVVLSGGPIESGVPVNGGVLPGRNAEELAENLIERVPGYAVTDQDLRIDGEAAVVLEGLADGAALPMAAVFTHADRAYLLFMYHEVPLGQSDQVALDQFLAGFEFTE